MGTTMSTCTHSGRQGRAGTIDFWIMRFLSVDPAHLAVRILHVPTHRHAGDTALTCFKHTNLSPKWILPLVFLVLIVQTGGAEA